MLLDTFSGRIGIEGAGRLAPKLTEQVRGLGFRAPEHVQMQDSRQAPPGADPSALRWLEFAHGGFYWHKFLDICRLFCHPPPTHRFSWNEIRKLGLMFPLQGTVGIKPDSQSAVASEKWYKKRCCQSKMEPQRSLSTVEAEQEDSEFRASLDSQTECSQLGPSFQKQPR